MWVKREIDIDDLPNFFWSGARDRWINATDDQRERVWDLLQDVFERSEVDGRIPTETEVNDFVWFECDDIFDEDEDEEETEESRKLERRSGDADNNWAEEIVSVASNLRQVKNLIESLINKKKRGVSLNKGLLLKSSVLDSIVREAIKEYQKDYGSSDFDVRSEITTATRNLIKEKLATFVLDEIEKMDESRKCGKEGCKTPRKLPRKIR